jgi:hypothetical protein
MADQLVEFIIQLSQNAKLAEQFKKDPDSALKTARLSQNDMTLLKSGDITNIRSRLTKSGEDAKKLLTKCYECFPTQ